MDNNMKDLEEIAKLKKEVNRLKNRIKEIENASFDFQEGRVRVSKRKVWEKNIGYVFVWTLGVKSKRLDYDSMTNDKYQQFSYAENLENLMNDIDDLVEQLTVVKNNIIESQNVQSK